MRRIGLLLLGFVVGVGAVYWADSPFQRLDQLESQLADAQAQLRGIEGTIAELPTRLDDVRIELRRVAKLIDPVDAAARFGHDTLYVGTRPGKVFSVDTRTGADDPRLVLDISRYIDTQGAKTGFGGEAGLLALAFSPGGNRLYVTYTGPGTNDEKSVEWTLAEFDMDGERADASSRRLLMRVPKRFPHHNGGDISFGPDGYLYTSIGDGAPYGDLNETGQDPRDVLGSLIRIDPTPSNGRAYSIPADNPFVDGGGAREVWAYGLRNPWRFDFDRATGDLWIADVGDREEEEIDRLEASEGGGRGANLGWSLVEGTHLRGDDVPDDYTPPIHAYKRRRPKCAIIGGYVYRGIAMPAMRGAFLFSDYCDGTLRAIAMDGDSVEDRSLGEEVTTPSSFAQDNDGELYVISLKGDVFRIEPA